ncbi:FAD-dependent oxidoreductase [Actinomycetospora sp. TBRC 11914]|uniref:FAD-dependent oxidoreductase n=1 Tax=Actinomycetospora sp. TBRC 11914 TaxID=2729387 RepID=UPI00145F4CCB|nr:FAD-dependent oxidoreductase [Actinomycetospora sp. TBRC 11914]NMO89245.1 FAD-dependent oxidoreductase [Actinomycetospora sp. TBRC 11914]
MRTHAVAIVGSGPSGFYAAGALLDSTDPPVRVDMYDRLATPWGLVRAGVAPDHPKIKSVSGQYEKIAAQPGFRFFGHVCLGEDVTTEELLERYDAVVYAVGSQTERRLGIEGEDRAGSHASVDFVGWYNGHPDYVGLAPDLGAERAVVIGAGNVALDVARMLLLPEDDLRPTDTADHAIEALAGSSVREVVVCGRRGPVQAAFTTTELRELDDIDGLGIVVDPAQFPDAAGDEDLPKATRRNVESFRRWAEAGPAEGAERRLEFRFLRSPVQILGEDADGPVTGVELAVNRLETDDDGRVRPVDTGERETVECGLVLRAVGYRGVALPGVPFDEGSGTIPHTEGRIEGREREYVVGWIKRGPTGIIGTNRKDANETVRALLADLTSGQREDAVIASAEEVEEWLSERVPDLVDLDGWEAIDAHERAAGEGGGRPRVKVVDRGDFMSLVRERM